MILKAAFVGERKHFVINTCRVTNAEHRHTPVHQFLANPVHGRITLGADQHLRFAVKRFVNGFHERGSLSGSRRAVNDGDIACA